VYSNKLKLALSLVRRFKAKTEKTIKIKKFPNYALQSTVKKTVPEERKTQLVSFEWSHSMISSTDSDVRSTLYRMINGTTAK